MTAGAGMRRSTRRAARSRVTWPWLARPAGPACPNGFTLVELVVVMVLAAVLAIFAVPRFISMSDFNARGFHDETLALMRYAQKTAIAQRRTVCVVFAPDSATLGLDADQNSATGTNGCEASVAGPRGDNPGRVAARSPVVYATTPTAVTFDALGQPGAGQTIQVLGAAQQIVIEAVTGYVHQ